MADPRPDPVRLRSVPGDLVLARRDGELLFCDAVDGASAAAAFLAAPRHAGLDAVTRLLDEAVTLHGPLAVLAWGSSMSPQSVRVVVNGDLTVVSDHPALPRLSGATAGTWVERTVRVDGAAVTLAVSPEGVDRLTDLRDGVIRAGGFELAIGARPVALPASLQEPTPAGPAPEPAREPLPSGRRSPAEIADALAAAARSADAPVAAAPTVDLPPPHIAPPGSADARDVEPDDGPVWTLVFADGSRRRVARPLVLGRDPDPATPGFPPDAEPVRLESPTLSALHLEIRPAGAELTVTDLGSRNGAFVVTSGDGRLARLDPLVAHRVERGTYVQIGTERFLIDVDRDVDGTGDAPA